MPDNQNQGQRSRRDRIEARQRENRRQQQVRFVEGQQRQLNQLGRQAWAQRKTVFNLKDQLDKLDQDNPSLETLAVDRIVSRWTIGLFPLFALILDILLMGPAARFLVSWTATSGSIVSIGQVVVPIAVIGAELTIAAHLSSPRSSWLFKGLGLVMAVVIPTIVVSTFLQELLNRGGQSSLTDLALCIAVASIAVVCHAGIIYGGRRAARCRSYVVYAIQRRFKVRKLRRTVQASDDSASAVVRAFDDYMDSVGRFNDTFVAPIEPGPFGKKLRTVVNEFYEVEVIRLPNRGENGRENDSLQPVGTPLNGEPDPAGQEVLSDASQNEYLRGILEAQRRQADSEVLP